VKPLAKVALVLLSKDPNYLALKSAAG
jgi:hypothetical protein